MARNLTGKSRNLAAGPKKWEPSDLDLYAAPWVWVCTGCGGGSKKPVHSQMLANQRAGKHRCDKPGYIEVTQQTIVGA